MGVLLHGPLPGHQHAPVVELAEELQGAVRQDHLLRRHLRDGAEAAWDPQGGFRPLFLASLPAAPGAEARPGTRGASFPHRTAWAPSRRSEAATPLPLPVPFTCSPSAWDSSRALAERRQLPALVRNTTGSLSRPPPSASLWKARRAAGRGWLPRTSTPSTSNRNPKAGGCKASRGHGQSGASPPVPVPRPRPAAHAPGWRSRARGRAAPGPAAAPGRPSESSAAPSPRRAYSSQRPAGGPGAGRDGRAAVFRAMPCPGVALPLPRGTAGFAERRGLWKWPRGWRDVDGKGGAGSKRPCHERRAK